MPRLPSIGSDLEDFRVACTAGALAQARQTDSRNAMTSSWDSGRSGEQRQRSGARRRRAQSVAVQCGGDRAAKLCRAAALMSCR